MIVLVVATATKEKRAASGEATRWKIEEETLAQALGSAVDASAAAAAAGVALALRALADFLVFDFL